MMRLKIALLAVVVGLVSALPFLRSVNQGVVCIDDYTYVVEHAEINGGFPSADVRWMFVNTDHAIFMPLTWFSYLTDCEIARHLEPANASLDEREDVRFRVMHVHSALLHGVNTALVFLVLLLVARQFPQLGVCAPMAAALFWGLHPLRVESVVWIASRKDLVSFFWLALFLLSWLKWRIGQGRFDCRLTVAYWLSLLFLGIGALGKPSVMIAPGLAMVLDVFILRSVAIRKDGSWNARALAVYILPALLGLAIAAEATAFQNIGGAMEDPTPLWARVLNALVSYGVYLKNTVWPFDLALQCLIRYPHPPRFLLPGLVVFGGLLWYFHAKFMSLRGNDFKIGRPDFVLGGLLWFSGALVPFIGIVGFGYHAYADRFTYIPALGLSVLLLGVVANARKPRILQPALLVAVLALVPITLRQVGFWKDEETVWKHTLSVDGEDNFIARVCLGLHAFDVRHDVHETLRYFNRAYELNPDFTTGFGQLYMNALSEAGEDERAFEFFKYFREWNKAHMSQVDPRAQTGATVWGEGYAAARIAMLLADADSVKTAEEELGELLRFVPRSQDGLYLKGRIAEMRGDREGAIRAWRQVLECVEPSAAFPRFRFLKNVVGERGAENGLE